MQETSGGNVISDSDSSAKDVSEEDFDVDRKHLMENIRDHYTIPIEEAVIVENVDNCIDEDYHTICFNTTGADLEILMLGDGMNEEVFCKILTKIAATTKFEDRRGSALGRYGWGMKISMYVGDCVIVETKNNSFHSAQSWRLVDGIPKRRKVDPTKSQAENFSAVQIKLKNEFKHMSSSEFLERTLQRYYPTILQGAKVFGKNGRKRELKVFIDSKQACPPKEIEYEKKKPLAAKVDGEPVTGYVMLAKNELNEEDQGIKIIVNGRKITKDFFGVWGDKNNRVTGYLHADILIGDLAGDKTALRKTTSHWRVLNERVAAQLSEFMKEIKAVKEEKLPEKEFRQIQLEINSILRSFAELQDLAIKAGISLSQDALIPRAGGNIATMLEPGSAGEHGTESGSGGGEGIPVQPGDQSSKAPSEKPGDKSATKEQKRRRGLNIYPRSEPQVRDEAWFSPGEGIIIANSSFPTYKKAERMQSRAYHMVRVGLEALLNYAAENGYIKKDKLKELRFDVLAKWGEL